MAPPNWSSGTGFTWVPSYPGLSANTLYTVQVRGIVDLDGTPVAPFAAKFTTGSSPVYGIGNVTVTPAPGATNVAPNAKLVIALGVPIDPASISNLQLWMGSGTPIPGAWSVSVDTATFVPALPYPSGAAIQLQGYLLSNTGEEAYFLQNFTVQAYSGSAPPFTVLGVSPANNLTGVSQTAPIVIRLSEPVASVPTNAVQVFAGDQFVFSNVTLSSDHKTITVTPYNVPGSTRVTVALTSSLLDLYGTPLTPFTSSFTTASTSLSSFYTTAMRPTWGAFGVSSTAHIFILVNRAGIDQASVQSGMLLTANGDIIQASAKFPDPEVIEIVPDEPLPAGSNVILSLNAHDTSGVPLSMGQITFTVASGSAPQGPQVVGSALGWLQSGSSSPVIEIEYDQPLLASSLSPNNFVLQASPGVTPPVPVTVAFADSTNRIIVITPQTPLPPAQYQLSPGTQGIQGANGLPPQGFANYYVVPASRISTPAHLLGTVPDNNWTGVGTNAELTLAFDNQLDEISVSSNTLQLVSGGKIVPINWSFWPYFNTIVIDPIQLLTPNTAYQLKYSGFMDIYGNAVAPGSVSFSTGAGVDSVGPQLLQASPAGSGLPQNAAISLRFDKSISTYPTSAFPIQGGVAWQFSADHKTLTAVPATLWPANTNVVAAPAILDQTGVGAGPGFTGISFSTGYAPNAVPPTIVATNPAPGASGLPRNVTIQVAFTTALSPATLGGITLDNSAGAVDATASLSADGTNMFVQPSTLLLPNTTYRLTITGITDTEGNPLAHPYNLTFTTGSGMLAPGQIVAENPLGQPAYLGPRTPVTIEYSQPVNPLTVSNTTFVVRADNDFIPPVVDGSVSVSSDGRRITFVPDRDWIPGMTYDVYAGTATDQGVATPILDTAGNMLPYTYSWTFTAPSALTAGNVAVSSVSPVNGGSAPENSLVQLMFTDNVDPATVSSSSITITGGNGTVPAGNLSVSGPLVTFTLAPARCGKLDRNTRFRCPGWRTKRER